MAVVVGLALGSLLFAHTSVPLEMVLLCFQPSFLAWLSVVFGRGEFFESARARERQAERSGRISGLILFAGQPLGVAGLVMGLVECCC